MNLLSAKTKREFQESYSHSAVLREIEYDFEDAGVQRIELPEGRIPPGQRRGLVAEYFEGINWTSEEQLRKALSAFESHLLRLEDRGHDEELDHLIKFLRRDGYDYHDGRILERGAKPVAAGLLMPDTAHLWKPEFFRLFLSHESAFKQKTALLRTELRKYQISGFVAHEDIKPSLEWQEEIRNALKTMDALAALLTEGFHASEWTDQEVGFALGRDVLIIAVRRDIDPYGFLGRHQAVPGFDRKVPDVARDIFEVLVSNSKTRPALGEALAHRLSESSSSDGARANVALLGRASPLTDRAKRLAEAAFRQNQEVRFASHVAEQLSELLGTALVSDSIA